MSADRLLALLRKRGDVPGAELDRVAREVAAEGEATAFRLAARLVEQGLLGESAAQQALVDAHAAATSAAPARAQPLEGRVFGNYRVVRRLDAGGMGAVYLAEHVALGRKAALKVLLEDLEDDPELIARFENEARILARIQHPNVVNVFDCGAEGGRRFILLEYVEGQSLAALLREGGPLAPARAARWAQEACLGLEVIHAAGLVHRDVKPENLLVTRDGRLKIADFGVSVDVARTLHLTATGNVVGTPLYMSPEQARGKKVDARSDLYSLGVTLYHMLAGAPPFDADSAFGVLLKHVKEKPPLGPLSKREAPPALVEIVQRALAKDPKARFSSARDMGEALSEFLAAPARAGALAARPERRGPSGARRPAGARRSAAEAPRGIGLGIGLAAAGLAVVLAALLARGRGPTAPPGPADPAPAAPAAAPEPPPPAREGRRLAALAREKRAAGKLVEARALFEAALRLAPDPALAAELQAVDATIAREKEAAARFEELRAQSESLPPESAAALGERFLADFPDAKERLAAQEILARARARAAEAAEATAPTGGIFGGRFGKPKEPPKRPEDTAPASAAPPPAADPAALAAAERRVDDLLRELGKPAPLAPATPHDAAAAALRKLRDDLAAAPAAAARAGWEAVRRAAAEEAAQGFFEALGKGVGARVTLVTSGGRVKLEGALKKAAADAIVLAALGGEVTVAPADLELADLVATREGLAAASPGVAGAAIRAPLAAAVLAADRGDLRDALARARDLRDDARREEILLALARRYEAQVGADLEAGRLREAWERLAAKDLADALDAPLRGALARARAAFPERALARAAALEREESRAEARDALELAGTSGAAPPLLERARPLAWRLAEPGGWLATLALGVGDTQTPGGFWGSWPRTLTDDDPEHARWEAVALPAEVLGASDGARVDIDWSGARQAGILVDHDPKTSSAIMVWLERDGVHWQGFQNGKAQGNSRGLGLNYGTPGRSRLRVELNGGRIEIFVDTLRCFAWEWPHRRLRGLGLYLDDGRAQFSDLALRKGG
jgi:serine/threonine-protein kinase